MAVIQQVFPLGGSAPIVPFTITFDTFGGTIPTNVGSYYNAQYGVVMSGLYFADFAYTDGTLGTSVPKFGAYSGTKFGHFIGTQDISMTIAAATGVRKLQYFWQNGGGWDSLDIQTSTGQSRTYSLTGSSSLTWLSDGVDLNALAAAGDSLLSDGFLTYWRLYNSAGGFGVIAIDNMTFSAS